MYAFIDEPAYPWVTAKTDPCKLAPAPAQQARGNHPILMGRRPFSRRSGRRVGDEGMLPTKLTCPTKLELR